jgi:hypothetical protein
MFIIRYRYPFSIGKVGEYFSNSFSQEGDRNLRFSPFERSDEAASIDVFKIFVGFMYNVYSS